MAEVLPDLECKRAAGCWDVGLAMARPAAAVGALRPAPACRAMLAPAPRRGSALVLADSLNGPGTLGAQGCCGVRLVRVRTVAACHSSLPQKTAFT